MRTSAGLLMFRRAPTLEVLLAHPGGPFWRRRDLGAWTLPKGEVEPGEDPLAAAVREFREETGLPPGDGPFLPLGQVRQKGGKVVHAWAFEGEWGDRELVSATFELEFPPRSGRTVAFPEIDRVAFFPPDEARLRILEAQAPFVDRLVALLAG